jgi:hypothetical protein
MDYNIVLPKPYPMQKEILDDTSRFKVVCSGRRVGKSTICQIQTIIKLVQGLRVAYITPEFGLAEKFYDTIINYFPDGMIVSKNKSRLKFQLVTGGKIQFFSGEALHRVRGHEFDHLIADEAAYLDGLEYEWNNAIRPLLMKTRGTAVFISTPKGRNYFYSLFQKGLNGEEGFKSWQFSSHYNPYLPKEELQELEETMPEANYRQEILAEPGENLANPFGTDAITRNTITTLSTAKPTVIAADLARVNDWTVIIGLDSNGVMCYFDRFKLPWTQTLERLQNLRERFPEPQIVVDSTGVGSVILEQLQNTIYNVFGFAFNSATKPKVMHELIKAVETNKIKFNEQTAKEMHTIVFKYSSSGNLKYEAESGFHDDCVMSLAMANHFRKSHNMTDTLYVF